MSSPQPAQPDRAADWEAFYRDYRKPGYVPGFEITTKLGGGMFGLVFRARKQSIGKDYAIKFLQVDDTEVRHAVLAELEQVKYFAQIDHPNLVSIEDRGEVDGIPYLVMSFAGTETLRDRMPAEGSPPPPAVRDELLRYFLQACRGLCALHERSLVHFDIKPANVFLRGPVARLGDYGLSKLVTHSRGSLSMGRGTPYYMAPEMLQRRGDHRSDVYSLGVMLYEILCGVVPFKGDSEWEVLRKHESQKPELPAHLSSLERAVLQRCLQKDPEARFQSVHDLIATFGSTVSVGAAAWSDVRDGALPPPLPRVAKPQAPNTSPASSAAPPPLPSPEQLPPPVPEDHVAGLGRASREAARHASKVAQDALQHAHRMARKAIDGARHQMGDWRARNTDHAPWLRGGHRRARAGRDTAARQDAKRAAAAIAAPRRPRSVLAVIGGVTILLLMLFIPALFFMSGGPRESWATSPAFVEVGREPPPLYHVVKVPQQYASVVSSSTPDWVLTAQHDVEQGRVMLRRHLAVLRDVVPMSCEHRLKAAELPAFKVEIWTLPPEGQARMLATFEAFLRDDVFDSYLANELMAWTPGVLALAAKRLGEVRFDDPDGAARAHRLHALLVYATGNHDIELIDDDSMSGPELARANRNLAAVWKWYLNEVARDQQTWQTFRRLDVR